MPPSVNTYWLRLECGKVPDCWSHCDWYTRGVEEGPSVVLEISVLLLWGSTLFPNKYSNGNSFNVFWGSL